MLVLIVVCGALCLCAGGRLVVLMSWFSFYASAFYCCDGFGCCCLWFGLLDCGWGLIAAGVVIGVYFCLIINSVVIGSVI